MNPAAYSKIIRRQGNIFERAFLKSKKAGKSTDDSFTDACTAAHHAYFQSRSIQKHYNNSYLEDYIRDTVNGKYDKIPPSDGTGTQTIRRMTQLRKGEFLIHDDVQIPLTKEEVFGGDKLMQQAFDYADAVRHLRTSPKTNYGFLKHKRALKDDDNPYLNVDLADVVSPDFQIFRRRTQG